jgi:hypothetical protein
VPSGQHFSGFSGSSLSSQQSAFSLNESSSADDTAQSEAIPIEQSNPDIVPT